MDGLRVGAVVEGRFRVDRLIGEGGMCLVYEAQHILTRKRLALKVLRRAHAANPNTRRRFLREARAACAVRHPNVLEIDDVLELPDSTLVLVMDRLHGESLARRLGHRGRMRLVELAPIGVEVIDAVSAAHAVGIVHRDLKPENIIIGGNGSDTASVKVIDFGIAKLTASEGDAARTDTETGQGTLLGTPFYMAPEQVLGDVDLDHRADIWALGVILYEALSGVRPIQGETVPQILLRITQGRMVPLEQRVPHLPPHLIAVVARMLRVDRGERPADLQGLRAILREQAHGRELSAARVDVSGRLASGPPVSISAAPTKTVVERRLRAAAPVATGVALLVAGTVALRISSAPAPNRETHSADRPPGSTATAPAIAMLDTPPDRTATPAVTREKPVVSAPAPSPPQALGKPAPPPRLGLTPDGGAPQPTPVVPIVPAPPEATDGVTPRRPPRQLDPENPWAPPDTPDPRDPNPANITLKH